LEHPFEYNLDNQLMIGELQMDDQSKKIFGSLIQAVGTIISAIGSTPANFIKSDLRKDLDLWGNSLQATGNALEVDAQGEMTPETIGNAVRSIGNVTVIAGLVIDFEEDAGLKLIITGNLIQALGGLVALADESKDKTIAGQSYYIIGNLLQSIGNSLQAIGGVYELEKNNNGQSLIFSGSWIQATGSVISLIEQIREENRKTLHVAINKDGKGEWFGYSCQADGQNIIYKWSVCSS
jgi:hypothetical protein